MRALGSQGGGGRSGPPWGLGRGEGRPLIPHLLELLVDSRGLRLSGSFGHCPHAASSGTRMTDIMCLGLMKWNSQVLGPQLPFAL